MEFVVTSASDTSRAARSFILANHGDHVQHLFSSMEDAFNQTGCQYCQSENQNGCCDREASTTSSDVFVAGVPCKPYSLQRSKRFENGSVKSHEAFHTTFSEFFQWLDFHNPKSGLVENVLGLDHPEDKYSAVSPLDQFLACTVLNYSAVVTGVLVDLK